LIALLFSPLGRYIAFGGFALLALVSAYLWIRADAVSDYKTQGVQDALERVQRSHRAGESIDVSPERLRDDDGHRRD
jgi:hypothetical protein